MTARTVHDLRAARRAALDSGDLPAQRRAIQDLYDDGTTYSMRGAERQAAATSRHYSDMVDPRGHGRPQRRVSEAQEWAAERTRLWAEASRVYAAARLAALDAAGLVVDGCEIVIGQTPEEIRSAEALRLMLRDYPPIGWGRSSPTTEERIARWRARPEADRISDPHPRIAEGEMARAAHVAEETR
jgi:hypothetical protein